MKIIRGLIIAICLAIIGFGCWKIYSIRSGYRQGERTYEKLEAYIALPSASPNSKEPVSLKKTDGADAAEPAAAEEEPAEEIDFPVVDFAALQSINPDVVGWIYCDGTPINYPIVQGADNEFYLDHLYDMTPNDSGAIFLDSRNRWDFSDPNSIVYGHNMNNGAMFAALSNFRDQNFFEAHPRFLMMTPQANYVVDIFAGVVVAEWDKVWQIDFADDEELDAWLGNATGQSKIETGVIPTVDNHILTLSTCSYEYDGARFVVMGILREV